MPVILRLSTLFLRTLRDDPATMLNNPVPFITGDIAQMSFPGELETDCQVVITQADPGPMTIAGFFPNLEGNEPQ